MEKLEKYNKQLNYSYTFGAFVTFELVKHKSESVIKILTHSKLKITSDVESLLNLCKKNNIEVVENDKLITKLCDKDNCYVVGVFKKYKSEHKNNLEVMLVNPSDMGNLGTIMRTMLGFEFLDLSIVAPCVDYFNPKVIRASMGAIFSLNVVEFNSFEQALNQNNFTKYLFMLDGTNTLGKFKPLKQNVTLVFGNEAHGLPNTIKQYGESVVIKHSKNIDSLNLPISVGMALYEFTK